MTDISISHDQTGSGCEDGEILDLVHRIVAREEGSVTTLSIVLAGHRVVRSLNQRFLGRDRNTDVLAFPLGDEEDTIGGVLDGEIYVDVQTAAERAPEFGVTTKMEVMRYIAHGILHLLGYSDATEEERKKMHRLENRFLYPPGTDRDR